MDLGLLPVEGLCGRVVRFDEGIDGLAQLPDRGEAGAGKRAAGEDREPDLDLVHEGEELDPAAAPGVPGLDLTRGDIERGEQGAVAVPLVFVRLAVERAAIGQLEVALGAFERLNGR